jgi:hypothetical protein
MQWRKRGFNRGTLILFEGHLIVLGEEGTMALVEAVPEEYRERASFQVLEGKCWTAPSLANGELFVRNEEEILCLDLKVVGGRHVKHSGSRSPHQETLCHDELLQTSRFGYVFLQNPRRN